mmetsp:Transcript_55589/g.82331  ORF Transcript_55589/g.82331 Transcript_55589/m.82331 type:complete len:84 (-) Transcript_55589:519-770(-)
MESLLRCLGVHVHVRQHSGVGRGCRVDGGHATEAENVDAAAAAAAWLRVRKPLVRRLAGGARVATHATGATVPASSNGENVGH